MSDFIEKTFQKAVEHFASGAFLSALAFAGQVHQFNPFISANLYLLGQIHWKLGSMTDALLFAEAAVVLEANNKTYLMALGEMNAANGNRANACAVFKKVLLLDPSNLAATQKIKSLSNAIEKSSQSN